jgi:nucleotide-binding universal stress UspA family protein
MIKSIVVGTDGSETAKVALHRAADLASQVDARVCIVSAFQPLSGVRGKGADSAGEEASSWSVDPELEVRSILDDAIGVVRGAGAECETLARRGDPAEALLSVAEERSADLIVVGNKGMTGTRRFLLGSVPDKISHHAPCSVLIVRTT